MIASVAYTRVFSARGAFACRRLRRHHHGVQRLHGDHRTSARWWRNCSPAETPTRYGAIGKQRSTHNNYLTLPVLVMMVSPHYPFLSTHPQSCWWSPDHRGGALIRHFINRVDAGEDCPVRLDAPVATFALICAIWLTAPRAPAATGAAVTDTEVLALAAKHCTSCHARRPTHESFKEAPKNVTLESTAELRKYAALILTQTVQNKAMPLGNQTAMTDEERQQLGQWIAAQH